MVIEEVVDMVLGEVVDMVTGRYRSEVHRPGILEIQDYPVVGSG